MSSIVWLIIIAVAVLLALVCGLLIGIYATYEQVIKRGFFEWGGRMYAVQVNAGAEASRSASASEPSIARIKVAFDAGVFDGSIAKAIRRNEERNGR